MSFFLFLAVAVICNSQVGRAIAEAIRGQGAALGRDELDAAEQRLEDHLLELEDRLEFAERLLQQQRNQAGLPPID